MVKRKTRIRRTDRETGGQTDRQSDRQGGRYIDMLFFKHPILNMLNCCCLSTIKSIFTKHLKFDIFSCPVILVTCRFLESKSCCHPWGLLFCFSGGKLLVSACDLVSFGK